MSAALLLFLALPAVAAPQLELSLAETEAAALARSPLAAAAAETEAAARDRADSQRASLLPRLTLDGSYRYLSELPVVAFGPGPARAFAAHDNYSAGPTLSWTLWDEGALRKAWKSQQARARSAEALRALAQRQVRLGARLAYFQLQLALENLRLLGDSLVLAQSQYEDIDKRLRAGAATRVDALSAHQQVLQYRREFRQGQAELSGALRELFALTGSTVPYDLALPLGAGASAVPAYAGAPTLLVRAEALDRLPEALAAAERAALDPAHPRLRAYLDQAEAARLAAAGVAAGRWPRVQMAARASYDYPNGPVLERVQQNALSLSATLPLFESGKTAREASEQRRLAAAARAQGRQAADELARDWGKTRDQLSALRAQESLDRESVAEAGEVARLIYAAYAAGGRTYLEVQSANLRALQARAAAARTRAQILIQLAVLDSLAAEASP